MDRPDDRQARQLATLWAAAAVLALALRPLWVAVAPLLGGCTFRRLTGVPCPTCGTTRSALAILDLDLAAAWATNPLATLVGALFILGGLASLVLLLLRRPLPRWTVRWNRCRTAAILIAIVANWAYLIATH